MAVSHGGEEMTKQALPTPSRYGWRWLLVLTGFLAWVSIGCNPQSLSMLLMPFQGDDGVEPEYKMFVKDKEVTLAIVTNFVKPDIRPDMQGADTELAEQISMVFRKRCEERKHKLKLIPLAQVRATQLKQQLDGGDYSPRGLGAILKADYVLDLTVNSFSLYEKGNISKMYRGSADISINLYQVNAKDGEHRVFNKEGFRRIHPRDSGPIDASTFSVTSYRNVFAKVVAEDIVKMFVAYSPDDKHRME
jgi:hypothetical protein